LANEPHHERRSIWRVGTESTWTTVLPVAFIIASLLSLVILPIVVSSHTSKMRREIALQAEPARRTANEVQTDLASELNKIIAFQVTGQAQYRGDYARLVSEQASDYAALQRLAPQLNEDVARDLALLIQQTNRWHERMANGEFLTRQLPSEVFQSRLFERHPAYEQALLTATKLELDIQDAIDDRLRSIRDLEKWNVSLTTILSLLALTSAMLVAGLGRQMRLLAREAMRRRQDAEREANDAKIARAAAEREERRAAFLASAGQELAASLDYAQTIEMLAKLIVANIGDICAIDLVEGDGRLRRATIVNRYLNSGADEEQQGIIIADVPDAIARVMNEREAKIVGAAAGMMAYLGRADATPRSAMAVPLVSRGETLGVVTIAAPETRAFSREDASLAAELARHGSLAIDNARLYLESQQAVRAREEVLAIVSHDLRNPLNAVMLAASMLKMTEGIGAEESEQLDIIDISAKRMRRLIEDLLDVARLEGGQQLPIELAPIDVSALMHEMYELFRVQASASSVSLQCTAANNVPQVCADRHRILQVLSNLVGNSLKFTPSGGVISCRAEASGREVVFTVADTGPGIPKEHLGNIFNPYWQAKRTARLGAGLGLPIAKGIVESHGGRIWVESEPGRGTKFFFTLPVDPPSRDGAPRELTLEAESPARR